MRAARSFTSCPTAAATSCGVQRRSSDSRCSRRLTVCCWGLQTKVESTQSLMTVATSCCCNQAKARFQPWRRAAWTFTLPPVIREKSFATVKRCKPKERTNRPCATQNWQRLGDACGGEGRDQSSYKREA